MKNTSILIPIILIACLLALAYLITQAFQDGRVATAGGGNDRIVLNPADYSDEPAPADIGAGTNTDGNLDDYFQEAEDDDLVDATDKEAYDEEDDPGYTSTPVAPAAPATLPATPASTPATGSSSGRYLVIAGSFRQLINARERVENLKKSGFPDSRLEKFNRGTFAVALAGQSDSYQTASGMADKIRAAGFEARVMRRR